MISRFGPGPPLPDSNGRCGEPRNSIAISAALQRELLARPQVAGHAGPAPRVDLHAHRRVGVDPGAVRDPVLVLVALVLAEHRVARLDRRDRAQDLQPLGAQLVALEPAGRVHQRQREQLQQVVLADVAQRAGGVVELAAPLDPALLGDRDLDRGDRAAVPQRLEDPVGEAQHHQVLRRLLAEVVVDAEELVLLEVLVQLRPQLARAREVLAERLLDHDAAVGAAAEADPRQVTGDLAEQRRRDRQVGEPSALAAVERLREALVEPGVVGGAVDRLDRADDLLPAVGVLERARARSRSRPPARGCPRCSRSARCRARRGAREAGRSRPGRAAPATACGGRGRPWRRRGSGSDDRP